MPHGGHQRLAFSPAVPDQGQQMNEYQKDLGGLAPPFVPTGGQSDPLAGSQ
jgi:hypothetical protein